MSAYDLLQFVIIGTIVALSAWTAFGKLAPKLRLRLLAALGHRPPPSAAASGCDAGCSSCSGCAVNRAPAAEQPVRFETPKR
jgi:hypothetical protein